MQYEILNAAGKRVMPCFTSWVDCVKILAKLHRLGMLATMRRIGK